MVTTLLAVVALTLTSFSTAQSIFINQVPAYSSLATCAEQPLSHIVRFMASGCGDDSQTTSYACFCTTSSSRMSEIISSEVFKTCSGDGSDAESALAVFSSYCRLSTTTTSTRTATATSAGSQSATPGVTATTLLTTTTPMSINPASTSSTSTQRTKKGGLSKAAKVAIGVVVPVIVILASVILAMITRCSQRRRAAAAASAGDGPDDLTKVDYDAPSVPPKDMSDDTSTEHGSIKKGGLSKVLSDRLEIDNAMTEKIVHQGLVELPTDGRYGNGTSAHELQSPR